jgi:ATP-dependent RNA/DNA helicase IGHMBP2
MEANDISQWANKQKELLLLESDSEKSQLTDKISLLSAKECEERGLSLLSLSISSTTTALFGRCCVSLVRSNNKLLARSFKVGDEVVLYCPKLRSTPEFMTVQGIVSKIQALSINIICDEIDESVFDSSIRVDLRANNSTFQKYQTVLGEIQNTSNPIVNLLFAHKDKQPFLLQNNSSNNKRNTVRSIETLSQELINPNLNLSQIKAVFAVLEMKQISVIHGPPGTGKTSTVVELIQQSAELNLKVLVCAPSNIAVDNILERLVIANKMIVSQKLSRKKLGLVRLGHPARVNQSTAKYCVDALIANDDGTDIVSDIREEIEGLRKELLTCRNGNRRKGIQSEIRILSKESRKREDKIVKGIIKHVDVVLCTCVTASSRLLRDTVFDIVIIDEAAQALEVSCWIPMLMSNRCVLVGDHNQLPPTVKSPKASSLSLTLFEKIIKNPIFSKFSYLLDIQYRMNDLICKWSSKYMYGGQLISHNSVASRTIKAIQNGVKKDLTSDNDTVLLKGKKKKIVEKQNENENNKKNECEEKSFDKEVELDGLEDTGEYFVYF